MEPMQSGSLTADWQVIWREHAGWLRTVLRARVRDELTADELLQEVSVMAWQHRVQLCDQDRIGPWLYRIAIRQVLMFWRNRGREQKHWAALAKDRAGDLAKRQQLQPLDWMTANECHQNVRTALAGLVAQDREILMLKHSEQWSYERIARHLGLSNDKVIYRLERARGRLRQQLLIIDSDWD